MGVKRHERDKSNTKITNTNHKLSLREQKYRKSETCRVGSGSLEGLLLLLAFQPAIDTHSARRNVKLARFKSKLVIGSDELYIDC